MNQEIQTISLISLPIAFVPAAVVIAVLYAWSLKAGKALYGMGRMLLQLLLVGYVLTWLFDSASAVPVVVVLIIMIFASSWIALGSTEDLRKALYFKALVAVAFGGGTVLLVVTQGVLGLDPWYLPQYLIPLAGMIFASCMNSVSLAAERVHAEVGRGECWGTARNTALSAALIPVINSLFAVGLVSLPGMMTGQILSGVSPLVAARYQIMVMCMLFGTAGIAAICFLVIAKPIFMTQVGQAKETD